MSVIWSYSRFQCYIMLGPVYGVLYTEISLIPNRESAVFFLSLTVSVYLSLYLSPSLPPLSLSAPLSAPSFLLFVVSLFDEEVNSMTLQVNTAPQITGYNQYTHNHTQYYSCYLFL